MTVDNIDLLNQFYRLLELPKFNISARPFNLLFSFDIDLIPKA